MASDERKDSRVQIAMDALVKKRKSNVDAEVRFVEGRRESKITDFVQNGGKSYDRRATKVNIAFDNLVTRRGTVSSALSADEAAKKQETGIKRLIGLTHEWLRHYSSITQIHGIRWYNLAPNLLFRLFFIFFFLTFIVALPFYFTNEGFLLYNSRSLSKSVEWKRDSNLTYPNITVCFAKFFDKKRMEAVGMSNNLANYMTMALDPNVAHLVKFMNKNVPAYAQLLDQLQEELDIKLIKSKLSIVDLFHKVAIKCEDFITMCEVHRRFLFSGPGYPDAKKCCGTLFNPVPFFSHTGTCFTTHATVFERSPFTFSSIKVWLNVESENSPEFDLTFKGSDALERKGAFYAVSHIDHPITKLMQSPYKVPKKSNVLISLSTRQIDRTGLAENQFCLSDKASFERQYHMEYSKLNCEFFVNSGFSHKCSLSPYYGVTIENDDPACQPRDFLNSTPYFSDAIYNPGQSELIRECLPTCFRSEYFTKITEAEIEPRTLRRFANQTKGMKIGDPEDLVVLQFYFSSFDYESHTLYKATLVDLLSKIGGWLGIINGSSIISVTELFVLFSIFMFKLVTGRAG